MYFAAEKVFNIYNGIQHRWLPGLEETARSAGRDGFQIQAGEKYGLAGHAIDKRERSNRQVFLFSFPFLTDRLLLRLLIR